MLRIVEGHSPQYRAIASIAAACGLRQGELFGLAEEDIDFDEMVIHVRRQVKKPGREFVFALPKNDTERTVPMSDGAALILKEHIEPTRPRAYTLSWEKVDGPPHTVKLLFRCTDDKHIRARTYDELVWKPALFHAGVIRDVIEAVDLPLGGRRRVVVQAIDRDEGCPDCGVLSTKVHALVKQQVRDILAGGDTVEVVVRKRRMVCAEPACGRQTFTQATEQLPARARCLTRLREHLADAVLDSGRAITEVAGAFGVAWWTVHDAVAAAVVELPTSTTCGSGTSASMSTGSPGPGSSATTRPAAGCAWSRG